MATKSGWLVKEGNGIKTWKKRWFTLKGMNLHYSKDEKKHSKGQDQGIIDLEDAASIKASNNKKKKNYCFEISTPDRTYFICASNNQEMQEWIDSCLNAKKKATQATAPSQSQTSAPSKSNGKQPEKSEPQEKKIGIEDFVLLTVVGEGSFGKVLRVRKNDNGKIYAMKVLDKQMIIKRDELEHTMAEKSILQKLDCPFLVRLHYTFQTSTKLYFIMDFVNGGELFFHLQQQKRFEPERVKFYCAEIVLGLKYLHDKGIFSSLKS